MKQKPLTNKVGQVRELTRQDIRDMRPAYEILPTVLLDVLPKRKVGQRGHQKTSPKISMTLRYSPEVIKYFKATACGSFHCRNNMQEKIVYIAIGAIIRGCAW